MGLPHAMGFLAVLLPPALLAQGACMGEPYFAIGSVLLVFPLARAVFGSLPAAGATPPTPAPPGVAGLLHALPMAYMAWLLLCTGILLANMAAQPLTPGAALGWLLSLWVTMVFAGAVAHELIHRRAATERLLGHALAGLAGYPCFGHEHLRHHRLPGNTAAAQWPRVDESLWAFAARRLPLVLAAAYGPQGDAWHGRHAHPAVQGLRLALACSLAAAAVFVAVLGWPGALLYLALMALLALSVQLITYIQHWGLGDDHLPQATQQELGWEDDCRFQAWVTMNLSLHHAHHHAASAPYHQLALAPGSPRLPAGYVLLMFAAMVPPLWFAVMRPALAHWRQQPHAPVSAGRRITCFGLYH